MTAPMFTFPKTLDYGATDPRLPRFSLGRQVAVDPRDQRHPLEAVTSDVSLPQATYWPVFASPIYQGGVPQCVLYSIRKMLVGSPVYQDKFSLDHTWCNDAYKEAQRIDEWPGEDYDGTSVRAGMKVLQRRGFISAYHWAETEEDIWRFVMTKGIVILGTDWTWDMCFPDDAGYIDSTGEVIGGHATALIGGSQKRQAYRLFTPWEGFGPTRNGRVWIRRSTVRDLKMNWGEASGATEIKVRL